MTQPPKALRADPRLDLYALAQAREKEVRAACAERCKDCPGPEHPSGCLSRPATTRPVAGRSDWPICPMGMLRTRAWEEIVDLYLAAKVSPIAGFPEAHPAWVQDGVIALLSAVRAEEDRQLKDARKRGSDGPQFTGRRVARGG